MQADASFPPAGRITGIQAKTQPRCASKPENRKRVEPDHVKSVPSYPRASRDSATRAMDMVQILGIMSAESDFDIADVEVSRLFVCLQCTQCKHCCDPNLFLCRHSQTPKDRIRDQRNTEIEEEVGRIDR